MIRTFLLLPLLVLGSAACDAQAPAGNAQIPPPIVRLSSAEASAKSLPPLTGRVVDRAGILDAAAEAELGASLEALEKRTTDQLVVVTVPSLDGEPIRDYGIRIANGWGIGQKDIDNGVLLIVAPKERQARIAVGYGLEGLLTDERAQGIMDKKIVPACREGRCDRAIADGVAAIAKILRSDRKRPQRKREAA
ncbi:MAG TPA: TPM domain-containing protein [Allosphingosinicella sp.]